jgi:hypothetical protein
MSTGHKKPPTVKSGACLYSDVQRMSVLRQIIQSIDNPREKYPDEADDDDNHPDPIFATVVYGIIHHILPQNRRSDEPSSSSDDRQ